MINGIFGTYLIRELSKRLTDKFGKGFTTTKGIIFCSDKDNTVVKYSIINDKN